MTTKDYSYNGKLWRPCATVADENSFFHSAFGIRAAEGEAYSDKHYKVRRMRWAAFLTYFENEEIPVVLADILIGCFSAKDAYKHKSIRDKNHFESYVRDITMAGQPVTKQEVPILSTLENIRIVLLSNEGPDPVVTVNPNIEILGDYSNVVEKSNEEVVLCLEGNTFTRLELVGEDSTSKPLRVIKNITAKEHLQHPTSCLLRYKKGGSAGSKGVEFQINLLMVLLFNSLRKLKDWKLSTENNKAGKFDDAILELPESAFLIQAKNKEKTNSKITLNALLSTNPNNSFSLPKYFLSYQEVKNQFKGKNTIIICTNAGIDKTALECLDTSRICTESVLYCADDNCSSHTFNLNILSRLKRKVEIYCQDKNIDQSVNTDNNLKDFLKRLQFYSNYPLGNNNKDKDTEILVSLLNCSGNFYGHISCSEIYAKLMKWFQQKHGIYLTETTANAMFLEIKSDQYWQKLDKYGVSFQGHLLNVQDKTQLYYVNAEGGYVLQELRIHHSLRKYKSKILYASPDGGIELQKRAIEAFELPCHTFLIFSWPEDGLEESVVAEICDKLRNTLNQYEKKKVILVAKSDKLVHQIGLNRSVCGIIDESVTFKDFCQVSQSKLLKEKVVFQGKEVSLEELLETQTDQDYTKKLCSEILEVLVKEEQIRVGLEVRPLDEQFGYYYIDRNLIRINDEKGFGRKRTETISENKIYEMKDKVVVIADAAGMGKSTVLSRLAVTIKNKNPQLWVIRIDLSDYSGILKDFKERNKIIDVTELLDFRETKLSNQLEEVLFSMKRKVVVLMDGVDEISPDYTELVIGLLVQCQKGANFDKVFVTTRPNMTQELESKLQVKSFSLLPFTKRHQIHFLTEYWAHNLKLDSINKKKCEEYAKILLQTTLSCTTLYQQGEHHFASIPLLLTMLAEIFESSDRLEESMDWEGCKEYLNGSRLTPKLQEKTVSQKYTRCLLRRNKSSS
uniref:NACHT domain-containing protein n=1 Tax=Anoplophora glabripennis TaxID=217634 RepID=V5FZN0_ANOGL